MDRSQSIGILEIIHRLHNFFRVGVVRRENLRNCGPELVIFGSKEGGRGG